ncbi:MAG: hypothetical protein WC648_00820 [Candidatus Paceibacterota bacterium]|jgi:hypothetical protein
MEIISEIANGLSSVIKGVFGWFAKMAPKAISLLLWILTAVIILPCVFVAGELYPKWVKWGEEM